MYSVSHPRLLSRKMNFGSGVPGAGYAQGHDPDGGGEEAKEEEESAAPRPAKRARKGRKGGKGQAATVKQDENSDPAPNAGD